MENKGHKNLIPQAHKLTVAEQSAGGKASVEARKRKKNMREAIQILLDMEITDKNGKTMTGTEALVYKQFEQALKGDKKAFELIRDTAGQKPIDKIQIAEVDQVTIDEVEAIFNDERTGDK